MANEFYDEEFESCLDGIDLTEEDWKYFMSILVDKNIISKEQENDYELLKNAIELSAELDYIDDYFEKRDELERFILSESFQQFLINMLNNKTKDEQTINWDKGYWEILEGTSKNENDSDFDSLCSTLYDYLKENYSVYTIDDIKELFSCGNFYLYCEEGKEDKISSLRIVLFIDNKFHLGNKIGIKGVRNREEAKLIQNIISKKFKSLGLICSPTKLDEAINNCLTETIYNKFHNREELTSDDLKFLYQIEKSFKDYISGNEASKLSNLSLRRIMRILEKRDINDDLAKIFGCNKKKVCCDPEELNRDTVVYYDECYLESDIDIYRDEEKSIDCQGNTIEFPEYFYGLLDCSGYNNAEHLKLPKYFVGKLDLSGIKSAKGLILPAHFNGELDLSGLESIKDLILPSNFNGKLDLSGVKNIDDFVIPEDFTGTIDLSGVERLENYKFPENFNGTIILEGLRIAKNVVFPKTMTGSLILRYLKETENVYLPEYIGCSLTFWSLEKITNVKFPNYIGEDFTWHVKELENFIMPEYVGGYFSLEEIKSMKNVSLSKYLPGGEIQLEELEYASNLEFPPDFEGIISLDNLSSLRGVKFPKTGQCEFSFLYKQYFTLEQMKELQKHEKEGYTLAGHEYNFAIVNDGDGNPKINLGDLRNSNEPVEASGDFIWQGSTMAKNVLLSEKFSEIEYFHFPNLRYVHNFSFSKNTSSAIYMQELVYARDLVFPNEFDGRIYLNSLKKLIGIKFPETGTGKVFYNDLWCSFDLIKEMQKYEETKNNNQDKLEILFLNGDNEYGFINFKDLENLERKVENLVWVGDDSAINLALPSGVTSDLNFSSVKVVYGLDLSQYNDLNTNCDRKKIEFRDLINAEGLIFPSKFNGWITLGKLTSLNGITFPQTGKCEFCYQGVDYSLDEIKQKQKKELDYDNGVEYGYGKRRTKSRGVISDALLVSSIILFATLTFILSLLLIK